MGIQTLVLCVALKSVTALQILQTSSKVNQRLKFCICLLAMISITLHCDTGPCCINNFLFHHICLCHKLQIGPYLDLDLSLLLLLLLNYLFVCQDSASGHPLTDSTTSRWPRPRDGRSSGASWSSSALRPWLPASLTTSTTSLPSPYTPGSLTRPRRPYPGQPPSCASER